MHQVGVCTKWGNTLLGDAIHRVLAKIGVDLPRRFGGSVLCRISSTDDYFLRSYITGQVLANMSATGESPDNVLGAIIFFSYIVTALGITGLIVSDLSKAYRAFSKSQANTIHRSNLILAFASFAAISFSGLSYHMLNVLIHSYLTWVESANMPFPRTLFGTLTGLTTGELSLLDIWTWAKSSTLFTDFAEVICNDPVRFWWTQQALLLSIGWNTYMAIEGKPSDAISIFGSI